LNAERLQVTRKRGFGNGEKRRERIADIVQVVGFLVFGGGLVLLLLVSVLPEWVTKWITIPMVVAGPIATIVTLVVR
jgi:hypothetical protein